METTFVTPAQQRELFAGCVYVLSLHKAVTPNGMLLRPAQFRVTFGGFVYFMDNTNQRVTRNAWEAFTQSEAQRPPTVHMTCSRPDLAPGAIIEEGGFRYVNIVRQTALR